MQIYPVFLPHAGCRQTCLFCNQQVTTGHRDPPPPEAVSAWLETVLPPAGAGEVAYFGGTFSTLPLEQQQAYLSVARRYVVAGRIRGVRVSTCPDALLEGRAGLLASEGVTTVEIGCQSFDEEVLRVNRRGHSVQDIHEAVESCRSAGVTFGLQLMPGLAGASADEAMRSLQAALALRPAFLRIYPTLVFEGTGLKQLWQQGEYRPMELDEAVDVVARQLLVCRAANVPVIRVGLQAGSDLDDAVCAGPWHPAFGQLVRSRLWRLALERVIGMSRVVTVHPSDLGDVLGHARANLSWLQKYHGLERVDVDAGLPRECFRIGPSQHCLQETLLTGGLV